MNDKRPDEFQLSDAPIHRIQTLVLSLQDSFKNLDGFKALSAAFFVRRDFDTRADAQCPVFNGTFYNPAIINAQDPLCLSAVDPQGFSVEQLEALHQGALNSAGTRRATLEKAIRKIKAIQDADAPSKLENIHSWLELFSRVTYNGGVAGFLIDHFNHAKAIPLLNLVKVRKVRKVEHDEWKDCLIAQWDNGATKWFGQKSWKDQPPLTTGCKIADPLYSSLQKWIERAEDWSGADSSPPATTPETPDQFVIAVPVYDFLNIAEGTNFITPWGAFLGFLFLVFPPTTKGKFMALCSAFPQAAPHLNAFAASLLESEFEEILREDFQGDDPYTFLAENLHRIDGWKFVTSLPGTQTLGVRQLKINLRSNLFQSADPKETASLTTSDCWTRYEDESSPAAENYRKRENRRIRYYAEQASLQESKKRLGKQSGFLASAHDYSKDLNALDIRLGHYQSLLDSARLEIKSDTAKLRHPDQAHKASEIADRVDLRLDQLQQPQLDWMLQKRFLISHQRTQTENRLYEQPEWCMQFVQGGTLRDLYRLCKVLVWLPVGHEGYKKLAEEQPDHFSDTWTWARLFAFENGDSSTEGKRLAVKLASVIKERFQKGDYTNTDFSKDFPPPTLKSHPQESLDIQLLWSGFEDGTLEDRWLPTRGLLPLLVFSLRAAFQHAWLRTVLDAANGNPGQAQRILVHADKMEKDNGHRLNYFIHIDFPFPDSESVMKTDISRNLPYGDWHKQVSHYRKLSFPWSVVTPVVTQHEGERILRITLKAYA